LNQRTDKSTRQAIYSHAKNFWLVSIREFRVIRGVQELHQCRFDRSWHVSILARSCGPACWTVDAERNKVLSATPLVIRVGDDTIGAKLFETNSTPQA